jgi:hypothetical protein
MSLDEIIDPPSTPTEITTGGVYLSEWQPGDPTAGDVGRGATAVPSTTVTDVTGARLVPVYTPEGKAEYSKPYFRGPAASGPSDRDTFLKDFSRMTGIPTSLEEKFLGTLYEPSGKTATGVGMVGASKFAPWWMKIPLLFTGGGLAGKGIQESLSEMGGKVKEALPGVPDIDITMPDMPDITMPDMPDIKMPDIKIPKQLPQIPVSVDTGGLGGLGALAPLLFMLLMGGGLWAGKKYMAGEKPEVPSIPKIEVPSYEFTDPMSEYKNLGGQLYAY